MPITSTPGGSFIRVEGARELRSTLRRAEGNLDSLKELNREAADTVLPLARQLAPRGPTGDLRASLRTSGTTRAGIMRVGRSSVPYAGMIHWGWPSRKIDARPFMVEARARLENTWIDNYVEGMQDILDRIEGA